MGLKVRWQAALDAAARTVQVAAITIAAKVRLGLRSAHVWAAPAALSLFAFLAFSPKGWLWG